jgi:hypothetical protein
MITFHYREQLLAPWESARGFLQSELEFLFAGLGPIGPLLDGLQAGYSPSSILQTNAGSAALFAPTLPAPLQFPPQLAVSTGQVAAGTLHNYNVTGLDQAAQLRFQLTGALVLTGVVAPISGSGLYRLFVNTSAFTVTLKQNNSGSSVGNRFRCPGAVDYVLGVNSAVWVWYDPLSLIWQVIGK